VKLVLGATGNVGGPLVRALAGHGEPVRAVTRAGADADPGVDVVVGDLDDAATLVPHLDGVDGMFLLSGYRGTPGLLEAAARTGVEHVVLLSAAAAESSAGDGNAVAAYHREAEAQVRASGLAWTLLRPVSFMSNTLRWRDEILAGDTVVEPFPAARSAVVDPRDIAAVAAAALRERRLDGRALRVTGPEPLLPRDRLAMLGAALGRDLRLVEVDATEVGRYLLDTMPHRYAAAFVEFFVEGTLDEAPVTSTVAEATGRPAAPFSAWVTEHAHLFRGPVTTDHSPADR
jgi:uncharacterized protein YbjT (DUF2867 family)